MGLRRRRGNGAGQLDEAYVRWISGVRCLGADGLWRQIGPGEGGWAALRTPTWFFTSAARPIHHGAEILLLRDLYRHREGMQ